MPTPNLPGLSARPLDPMIPDPESNSAPLLRVLVEATSGETGIEFFRCLTRAMCEALHSEGAWVTEFLPEKQHLRSLAFRLGDGWVEEYEYHIEGTPCGEALRRRDVVFVPERVLEAFPQEHDLRRLQAVSYIGTPLFDERRERILGHVGAFSVQAMPDTTPFRQTFRLFESRAGAELRRLRLERDLRARTEELEAILQSAMDGILIVDSARRIVRANAAAARILATAELEGETLDRFLPTQGAQVVFPLLEALAAGRETGASRWIPGTFEARDARANRFVAEGTLSRFDLGDRSFITLILRNVSDRVATEVRLNHLAEQAAYLREEVEWHFGEIVGESPAMRQVLRDIREVAKTDAMVLITGETGTGKELVARALHRASKRASMPLIKVNCAAIPATLIESEFFGHEKGAFTGATARRDGRFALADGGTLFLDEIGELPLDLQAKLLRVLQEGEFEPVGSARTRKVDARVIAATHRDLRAEAAAGRFREDLYYRISVFPIHVPALRHRGKDVALLAREGIKRLARREGCPPPPLSADDLRRLEAYAWPGNVRELMNVLERAVITGDRHHLNLDRALPADGPSPLRAAPTPLPPHPSPTEPPRILTAAEMIAFEAENLRRALESAQNRITGPHGAARLLGLKPSTLRSRLKALGLR